MIGDHPMQHDKSEVAEPQWCCRVHTVDPERLVPPQCACAVPGRPTMKIHSRKYGA